MRVNLVSVLALFFLAAFAASVYAQSTAVHVEFFYFDPSKSQFACWTCPGWKESWDTYVAASNIIDEIEKEYGNQVQIERVDKTTPDGLARFNQYGLTEVQAVVVNSKIKLEGELLTKEQIKWYIDSYLRGEDPSASVHSISAVFVFSLGLFSGLSPCLMAMLAFILSYTSGTVANFKSGIFRVSVFGAGFVLAIMLLGAMIASILVTFPSLYIAMMWGVSGLIFIVGLHLIGWLNVPFGSKPLVQKLARKLGATHIGLFLLGFVFYFVNLCTAPLSFTILPAITTLSNLYLLALFGLGVIIPFLAVGVVAGGSPALAKRIREQHRTKIRALSGIILLAYSVWFVFFNLLYAQVNPAFLYLSDFLPYLIAMFAFALVYSAHDSPRLREGMSKSLLIGLGFTLGTILVAASLTTTGESFYMTLLLNQKTIVIIASAIMIFIGLALLNILQKISGTLNFKLQPARSRLLSLAWLFALGFLIFFVLTRFFPITRFIIQDTSINTNLLAAFNLELLFIFLIIGAIGGIASSLRKETIQKYRVEIRALSGLILIAYAFWLLWQII
jgi:cytochrome c biogenesis protein CcdA